MKKHGYIYYDADCSNGDNRRTLFRCRDGITVDSVFDTVLVHRPEFVYDAVADMGYIVYGNDFVDAVADCQRGNVEFWVNVVLTDAGVQIGLSDSEPDAGICHDDMAADLQEFSDYLHSVNVAPAFSDDSELPF